MQYAKIAAIRGLLFFAAFLWLLPSIGRAGETRKLTCDAHQTIGEELGKLKPGDTLLVSGTCNENVVVREEIHRITVDGQGSATINSPDPAQETVVIRGRGIYGKRVYSHWR